jgi:hypothetical protein
MAGAVAAGVARITTGAAGAAVHAEPCCSGPPDQLQPFVQSQRLRKGAGVRACWATPSMVPPAIKMPTASCLMAIPVVQPELQGVPCQHGPPCQLQPFVQSQQLHAKARA